MATWTRPCWITKLAFRFIWLLWKIGEKKALVQIEQNTRAVRAYTMIAWNFQSAMVILAAQTHKIKIDYISFLPGGSVDGSLHNVRIKFTNYCEVY